jgi:hypothetical protein
MRMLSVVTLAAAALAASAAPVAGHHAFAAEFDANKPITLKGVVTKMEWVNPHMWMYVDVKDASGNVVTWAVEGGAPNALFRRGFRKDSLPVGIEVTVEGYLAKSGKPVVNGRNVTYPDGTKLFMGSSGTGAPGDPASPTDPR